LLGSFALFFMVPGLDGKLGVPHDRRMVSEPTTRLCDPPTTATAHPRAAATAWRPVRRSWAEPWKVKVVEPVRMLGAEEQARGLRMVHEPKYLRFFQTRFEPL